ncbi:hypothetical protein EYF80_055110 [Liparis tanakae]|uniref:Uncharacterized protein n=1 Tax=Liparis tanakae TaxID=230148 RepID=A0A4Z2F0J9_9TELE|nr:hypothetical protein EYF80_055110 [Liparis tanakae]
MRDNEALIQGQSPGARATRSRRNASYLFPGAGFRCQTFPSSLFPMSVTSISEDVFGPTEEPPRRSRRDVAPLPSDAAS